MVPVPEILLFHSENKKKKLKKSLPNLILSKLQHFAGCPTSRKQASGYSTSDAQPVQKPMFFHQTWTQPRVRTNVQTDNRSLLVRTLSCHVLRTQLVSTNQTDLDSAASARTTTSAMEGIASRKVWAFD